MITQHSEFIDLAPNIVRRRLVIECIHKGNFNEQKIYDYMVQLSNVMNMTIVTLPTINDVEEKFDVDIFEKGIVNTIEEILKKLSHLMKLRI